MSDGIKISELLEIETLQDDCCLPLFHTVKRKTDCTLKDF